MAGSLFTSLVAGPPGSTAGAAPADGLEMAVMEPTAVNIGDEMRISVELIRQMAALPNFTSLRVRLKEIRVEADGTKTLWVENVESDRDGR